MPTFTPPFGSDYCIDEVYPPAEDTYLLLRAALAEARPEDLVLEIGCGRGVLTQDLSSRVKRLIATDINPRALRATRSRADRFDLIRADLFQGIKERFDLVLFNPPYLPERREERVGGWIDWALDGGESGRETINRFLTELESHLRPGGRALLVSSSLTGIDEVLETAYFLDLLATIIASERCFFEQLYVLKISLNIGENKG